MYNRTREFYGLLWLVIPLMCFSGCTSDIKFVEKYIDGCLRYVPDTNTVKVRKELYVRHPKPGVSAHVGPSYMGPGLKRREAHTHNYTSDTPSNPQVRYSHDNGRTWSQFEPLPKIIEFTDDYHMLWGSGPKIYDPDSGLTVSVWLRQIRVKGSKARISNHCYWRTSDDFGLTWSEPTQIRYEPGAYYDPDNPLDSKYLKSNQMYPGNNIIRYGNGTLIHCGADIRIPDHAEANPKGKRYDAWCEPTCRYIGSACFVGKWNLRKKCYHWERGECAWVPMSVSSRGLLEPEVAELKDGRVLVIWRGNNTDETPGHKWYSVSEDGGLTLSDVHELKYDDGTGFYSPGSFHRMIRHSVTGKLYWVGNITSEPPDEGLPRWPLVIAEVDEDIPALKRDTVTIIDTRHTGEGWGLQLSNFSLLENRQTHEFEIYLTRIGTKSTRHHPFSKRYVNADCYKYTLSID